MTTRARHFIEQFWGCRNGSISIVYAVAAVPLIGSIGVAVDYARAADAQTAMQSALDAAVLAGMGASSNRDALASSHFYKNFVTDGVTVTNISFKLNADNTYSGQATANYSATFSRLLGFTTLPLNAKATTAPGQPSSKGKAMCIIALNPTLSKAVNDSASSTVNAPDCTVQVNSNNTSNAVNLSGSAQIKSAENCFVGKPRKSLPCPAAPLRSRSARSRHTSPIPSRSAVRRT